MNPGMSNVGVLCGTNFALSLRNNLLVSVSLLCFVPVVQGISYLNEFYSAQCMESFVIIPGIIFLVPILLPEQNEEISEIVYSKAIPHWKIILLRAAMAIIYLIVLIACFAGIMKTFHCQFPYFKYVFGTVCSAIALGSMGLFVSALSRNTVIGYLTSIGYLLFDMSTKNKYLGKFTLSSLQSGSFSEKYWLMGLGLLLVALTVFIKKLRTL